MSSLRARSLKDIVTFTRASTATYCNRAGVLTTAAIDEPRLDHDPVTRAPRGLLVEEARTNHLLRSRELSSSAWTKIRSVVSENVARDPWGDIAADKLIEDSTAGDSHYLWQSYTKTASNEVQSYALSVFAKAGERTRLMVVMQGTSGSANAVSCLFDLATGTAGTVTTAGQYDNAQAGIERWADGWFRCSLIARVNNDAQATIDTVVLLANAAGSTTYNGDGASGLFLCGAQLEKGAHVTSCIDTTSVTVSRAADVVATSVLEPWFHEPEGTLYVEYAVPWTYLTTDANDHYLVEIDGGTVENRHVLYHATGNPAGYTSAGGATQANPIAAGDVTAHTVTRAAYAWVDNDVTFALTGAALSTVSGTVVQPAGLTAMRLGAYIAGTNSLNGWIRALKFYPRRLSDNDLRALVA